MRSVLVLGALGGAGQEFNYVHHGQDWSAGECYRRERQSPIDFDDPLLFKKPPEGTFFVNYQPIEGFTWQNNGHSVAADFVGKGYGGVTFRNDWYNILSMNFHLLSEHTFHGKHFPAEIHLVHKKYDSGHVLVLALPVEEGLDNSTLSALLSEPVPDNHISVHRHGPLDLNQLAISQEYFLYKGSLTAPPCYEIVSWFVRRTPITMSADQLRGLHMAIYNGSQGFGNYRSTMPLMGRPIQIALAVQGEPAAVAEKYEPLGAKVRAAPFRAIGTARRAQTAAEQAKEQADDLVYSASRASKAHLRGLPAHFVLQPEVPQSMQKPPIPTQEPRQWFSRIASAVADQAEQAAAQAVMQAARAAAVGTL